MRGRCETQSHEGTHQARCAERSSGRDLVLATGRIRPRETNPEFERLLLRAGQLGSVNAQRELGVMHATRDWSGSKDLTETARWYRLAAERVNAEFPIRSRFHAPTGPGRAQEYRGSSDVAGRCRGTGRIPNAKAAGGLLRKRVLRRSRGCWESCAVAQPFGGLRPSSAIITPAQLDEKIGAAGLSAVPAE